MSEDKKHWLQRADEPWKEWMHSAANYECEFVIYIRGPMDRKGIEHMIKHLELIRDIYDRPKAEQGET